VGRGFPPGPPHRRSPDRQTYRRRRNARAPRALAWSSSASRQAHLCLGDPLFAFRTAVSGYRFSGSLAVLLLSLFTCFFNLLVHVFHVQAANLLDQLIQLLSINCTRLGENENVLTERHQGWN